MDLTLVADVGAMLRNVALIDAARLTSLASGRGDAPALEEWLWLAPLLLLFGFIGFRLLQSVGLTRGEAFLVAVVSPFLVFVDAPLGDLSAKVGLAANATGCIIPLVVGLKIFIQGRVPLLEGLLLFALGTAVSFAASEVVPTRGVLLQYRVPAVIVGLIAAGLLFRMPDRSGAAGFAAGGLGVIVGADIFRLAELSGGGAGRIILGGAALLDGILLVAVLAAAIAEGTAMMLRALVGFTMKHRAPGGV